MKFLAFLVTFAFVHTAGADEPWMYPIDVKVLVTPDMHNSHAIKIARVSRPDAIHSEVSTRMIDADVASFEDIAKWYSESKRPVNRIFQASLPHTTSDRMKVLKFKTAFY